ncbi:MAG: SNF2 helicase-associated domain-containing protein [Cyanobium sp.]
MVAAPHDQLHDPPSQSRIERLAAVLVAAGRVTPALETDGAGGVLARWWPLPAPEDRPWLEALLPDDGSASQRHLAEALASAVDRLVRQRLRAAPGALGSTPKPTPASAPLAQAWLRALAADDPRLPGPLAATAGSSVEQVASWVRQAVAPGGDLRLALRCHEPADGRRRRWTIELLLGPAADPSLLLPLADFWAGGTPFAPSAFEAVLQQLGLLTRLAPELAALLRQAAPAQLELEEGELVSLVSGRAALLAEAGFGMLLPSGLRQVSRLGLRAQIPAARGKGGKAAPAGSGGGLDLARLFQFEWQAVLGDQPLSPADLEALQRAAALKRPLVRLRGHWTLVDAAAVAGLLRLAGQPGEASGAELLRGGLGLERLGVPAELELAGVEAPVPLGSLLAGELRPYQQRGLGWLVFLGQLGLGACLADDMGLGKTAQLLNGEVPRDLEEPFEAVRVPLFPRRWDDLQVRCGCPDAAVPCKHIAAVLYVFAQRLDEDPWLLLAWHGRDREQLLASLRRDAPEPAHAEGLPPWWPVGLRARPAPRLLPPDPLPPDPPERALQRLGTLELPGMEAEELERRLAGLYRQLLEGELS